MGIYLGQLPPAEVARLKAELAETLIASFCYPRFFDYRTGTLRMRPVDRSKRQEVWLYLSSVDFTAWSRIDLMSPAFQYQIERLFIQFVQRNRSFFGEQGRKRMSDIRMLINATATTVAEDLRNHLTGRPGSRPPFGSPRPVPSWTTTNISGRPDPSWEQVAPATFLLQQQLQEVRGEIKGVPQLPAPAPSDARQPAPVASAPKRPARGQAAKVANGNLPDVPAIPVQAVPVSRPVQPVEGTPVETRNGNGATSPPVAKSSGLLQSPAAPGLSNAVMPPPAVSKPVMTSTPVITPAEPPVVSPPTYSRTEAPTLPQLPQVTAEESAKASIPAPVPTASPEPPQPAQGRSVPQPVTPPTSVTASQRENAATVLSGEDVAIFEQMQQQLVIWLRVEVVHCGLEIAGRSPAQLVDVLRQQGSIDETRLQVVSSLLNLAHQVIKNGQASLLDYKQALMFHLMHTRSMRSL